MKIKVLVFCLWVFCGCLQGYGYEKLNTHIHSPWSEEVAPENIWNVYPRPTMEREQWENLNGLWNYSILPIKEGMPKEFQGEILVPFPVESDLSGVGKKVGSDEALWYRRNFRIPSSWKDKEVLLNFGAVDWSCEVWVNDIKVGSHKGGYTPFSLNITSALSIKGDNTLTVKVTDPTNDGYQPRGKQVKEPKGIWYTSVTGIWQTVWLEPVSRKYITGFKAVPDIDSNSINFEVLASEPKGGLISEINIMEEGKLIASSKGLNGEPLTIHMPEGYKLWSPEDPYLYDLEIILFENGKPVDKVKGYTAMRKISTSRDRNGVMRLQLNNKDLFQIGPLDQGWWPDGLYTAPSYEAMIYDIDKTKDLGFNMIRKHVKVEPATWYTYCDKNGILVWQDMPSGDKSPEWQQYKYFDGVERNRSMESEDNYRREWKEIMDLLYNNPSVVVWVPFNEAWGQFKTENIAEWTKSYDPSRLVNAASGGNHYHTGDIMDIHHYPDPQIKLIDGEKVNVLGEYGGIGLAVQDHVWSPDRNWGYVKYNSPEEVTEVYVKYADELLKLVLAGYSAAVYTQTTDVENEVNGLITYDRKIVKVDENKIREANTKLTKSLDPQ